MNVSILTAGRPPMSCCALVQVAQLYAVWIRKGFVLHMKMPYSWRAAVG